MGLTRSLLSLVTAPLAARLEVRLRGVVESVLEDRDHVLPSTLRELGSHLAHARTALDELAVDIREARHSVDRVKARRAQALSAPTQAIPPVNRATRDLAATLDAAAGRLVALRQQAEATEGRYRAVEAQAASAMALAEMAARETVLPPPPTSPRAPSPPAASPAPAAHHGCKVEGCKGQHRARGFCGRHYQLFKRGHLVGFVLGDGTALLSEDGPRVMVDVALVGQPVREVDGRHLVGDTVIPG